MNSYSAKNLIIGMALVLLGLGAYRYALRGASAPEIERVGGTVLVYEVDVDFSPAGSYAMGDLLAALARRLDPDGREGVRVQALAEGRVEIGVPRAGNHAERVAQVRELVRGPGVLEVRVVADGAEDAEGLAGASRHLAGAGKDPRLRDELARRARAGLPPPAPPGAFTTPAGRLRYSWVELGRDGVRGLNLDLGAAGDPAHGELWRKAARARERVEALGGAVLYSRGCENAKVPLAERLVKRYEYFLLAREASEGKALTGADFEAEAVEEGMGRFVVRLRPGERGAGLLAELTSGGRPRRLAAVLDGVAVSLWRGEGVGRDLTLAGGFTEREAKDLAGVLRSGALPARLLPQPASERSVPPRP
jgi:preprotein translocase subunit SecD